MVNLLDIYTALARERPDEPALIFEREPYVGIRLSWAQLAARGEELSLRLAAAGLSRQSLCAVELADHPDTLPLLLGIWHLAGTALLVDPKWGDSVRRSVYSHSRPNAFITVDPQFTVSLLTDSSSKDEHSDLPDGAALLAYTSGSTGDPKGIAIPHDRLSTAIYAAAAAIVRHRGAAPKYIACSMRLSGFGVLILHYMWAACTGAAVVVLPELNLRTAPGYWRTVADHDVEQIFLVPPLIELLNQVAAPPQRMRKVPICISGSAPLSQRTQQQFQSRFNLGLLNAYGLTETMCTSFFGEYDEHGMGRNTIGTPALLKAQLRDRNGTVVEGVGEGELELSGPTLFDGYYRNTHATETAFHGSWLRTGDLLRRDEQGRYWMVGRLKNVVMKGGHSIHLDEVESAVFEIDGIDEAAGVPLQLPAGGEDFGLLVRLLPDSGLTCAVVAAELGRRLGAHHAPRRVIQITQALPRTGQQKIDRPRVVEMWRSLVSLPGNGKENG
jgi:long-chain acyl-CoA synthetase